MLDTYASKYHDLKAPRKLKWKPALGSVGLTVRVGGDSLDLTVSPLHASVIMHFQVGTALLAAAGKTARPRHSALHSKPTSQGCWRLCPEQNASHADWPMVLLDLQRSRAADGKHQACQTAAGQTHLRIPEAHLLSWDALLHQMVAARSYDMATWWLALYLVEVLSGVLESLPIMGSLHALTGQLVAFNMPATHLSRVTGTPLLEARSPAFQLRGSKSRNLPLKAGRPVSAAHTATESESKCTAVLC